MFTSQVFSDKLPSALVIQVEDAKFDHRLSIAKKCIGIAFPSYNNLVVRLNF